MVKKNKKNKKNFKNKKKKKKLYIYKKRNINKYAIYIILLKII